MKKLILVGYLLLIEAIAINAQSRNPFMTGLNPRQSCTIIYAFDGKMALSGNNEDYNELSSNILFLPAEDRKFGRIYFGFDVANFPQGGMNEKGLFFDGANCNKTIVVPRDTNKAAIKGQLILKAMEECSTVEEVRRLFEFYDFSGPMNGHYLVGDRFGNSMIIEPHTFIMKKGKYQIVTNFYQSEITPEQITDYRFKIASQLLEQADTVSIELFRRVLNITHYEYTHGEMSTTLYSYICDLKKGEIYVYNFHNFEEVVKINLNEELKKGKRICSIPSLFPYATFAEMAYRQERIERMSSERTLPWFEYISAHIVALAILYLLARLAGLVARKKGYDPRKAFIVCFICSTGVGVIAVGIIYALGGRGCGGIVSIAVALIVILYFCLRRKKVVATQPNA